MSSANRAPLNTCGCCEVGVPATPEPIHNRPGLSAIRYRVGTFSSFRQAMLEAIAGRPELRNWTGRTSDDYGIAVLEMWAYLGDILTFYQERTANEAFLRTALLRESVLRLAALLDYQLHPGVATVAELAFITEKDKRVLIPVGLRVQSVPGQDERPQKFETVKTIEAEARLNQVRIFPRPQLRNPLAQGTGGFLHPDHAEAIAAALAPGDKLVVFPNIEEKIVTGLETVDSRTLLKWTPAIQAQPDNSIQRRAFKWLRKLRLFGYNAPKSHLVARPKQSNSTELEWSKEDVTLDKYTNGEKKLKLDALYDDLRAGTRVLIDNPEFPTPHLTTVASLAQVHAETEPLEASVTQIALAEGLPRSVEDQDLRQTIIYELAEPEILFWTRHYPDLISGTTVYVPLEQLEGLPPKRALILDDKEKDPQRVTVVTAEPVDTDEDGTPDHLAIAFTPSLPRSLDARTAVLYGNIARATHGETVANEVLGSGDASAALQSFAVKKSPVTFVPEPSAPRGAASTLQVRVDGILWHETRSLFGQANDARIYTTRIDNEGVMTVRFGDGKTGARLPSGRNNVLATYRHGLGLEGRVRANTLTTLLDRPVGLRSVSNAGDAEGGADPETLDEARTNAPNTVRTFDRIVSLRDFEDAAREFAGVAKARATPEWDGDERVVHLTVAGDGDALLGLAAKEHLVDYLNARRDPNHKVVVENYTQVFVLVAAKLLVHPDYVEEKVRQAGEKVSEDFFAFERLALGQPIQLSDLYRVLQEVEGVVAVDIDRLLFKKPLKVSESAFLSDLRRRGVRFSGGTPEPVQPRLLLFPNELARIEEPLTDIVLTTETGPS